MNKIPQIISKIQELVPEVMELKFGCKVNRHCGSNEYIAGTFNDTIALVRIKDGDAFLPFEVPRETMFTNIPPVTPWEILGRDLTLQDLLLAIGMSSKCIYLKTLGNQLRFNDDEDVLEYYDLSKSLYDNLDDEQFSQFIFNLLCK